MQEIVLYLPLTTRTVHTQDFVRVVVTVHTHVIVVELHAVATTRRHELADLRVDFSDHVAVVVDQAGTLENHLLETVRRRVLLDVALLFVALRNEEGQGNEGLLLQ